MKLLACNVENFGTLSGFKMDFSDGLTVINEQNGFGKSTLALFFKAMFYGLPKTTKKKIAENERIRLTPWQGGLFGGTLDFQVGNKKYRIERSFSDKAGDTFKLYDLLTGKASTDYSENIGLELFGIDAESFERSVYVPQDYDNVEMNIGINAKLTGLVENSDDLGNYDKAYSMLEKRAKEYQALRGNKGLISDLEANVEQLTDKIRDAEATELNLKRINEEIQQLKNRQEELTSEKDKVRQNITVASDQAALVEQKKSREALELELTELHRKQGVILERYPDGLPDETEISNATEQESILDVTETELKFLINDISDSTAFENAKEFFKNGAVTENEIAEFKQKASKLAGLKFKLETLRPQASTVETAENVGGAGVKIAVILAAILLISGAVVTAFQTAIGIILLALGVLSIGTAGFLYLKSQILTAGKGGDTKSLARELEETNAECEALSKELTDFIEKYLPVTDFENDINTIADKFKEYSRLKSATEERNGKITARQSRVNECKEELEKFFEKFGKNPQGKVAGVRLDVKDAESYSDEIKAKTDRLAEMPEAQLNDADTQFNREELLSTESKLNAELDFLQNELTRKTAESSRLSAECELLPQYEEQLDGVKSELNEKKAHNEVLKTTMTLLATAKENLSMRYLGRMSSGFKSYCDVLNGKPDDFIITPELQISVERVGKVKEQAYFSTGVQDMMNLAMRLSLADALFEKEQPMLILDDPFVNLDDTKLNNALNMLKELAKTRQIIYLTCHSSRTV